MFCVRVYGGEKEKEGKRRGINNAIHKNFEPCESQRITAPQQSDEPPPLSPFTQSRVPAIHDFEL